MTEEFQRVQLKSVSRRDAPAKLEKKKSWFSWLFGSSDKENAAPTPRRQKSSKAIAARPPANAAALAKMRDGPALPRCPACNKSINANAPREAFCERTFHRGCFTCGRCGGVAERASSSSTSRLRCAPCASRDALERRGHVVAAVKTRAGAREVAIDGDVDGVLDAIGDELEAVVDANVPTCTICGFGFKSDDEVVAVGMLKWHPSCKALGRPRHGRVKSRGTVQAAADATEALLTVSVSRGGADAGRTFFFVKDDAAVAAAAAARKQGRSRAPRSRVAAVPYVPDESSRSATVSRRVPGAGPLRVAVVGDPAFPDAAVAAGGVAALGAVKHTFRHAYAVAFDELEGGRVRALDARLTIAELD